MSKLYKDLGKGYESVTLTVDDYNFKNQSDTFTPEDSWNYMALTFIVKYESKEDSKIENLETTNFSQEESDDEENLQEAYDKIFEESLKLKKQNWSIFKKLHVF